MGCTAAREKGCGDAGLYLLALLHTQLPADLDALDCVDEEVPGSILQLVLVEGTREVPTQEDNGIGQELRAAEGKQGSARSSGTLVQREPHNRHGGICPHCLTPILFKLSFFFLG